MGHNTPRLIVVGAVKSSATLLEHLISLKANVVGVVAKKTRGLNADFADLSVISCQKSIPTIQTNDINEDDVYDFLRDLEPDYLLCLGWSQLIGERVLKVSKRENIGFHPSLLPKNRGRHPVVWALALGLEKTGSSFFLLREKPDFGPVLVQNEIKIEYGDNASSLLEKISLKACEQLTFLLKKLESDIPIAFCKSGVDGNVWRRRGLEDGQIDFRMSSRMIYNLTRALTRPYVGAHINFGGANIKVWRAEEVKIDLPNIEPGRILSVEGRDILVKTADAGINLQEHEFEPLPDIGFCF